MQVRVLKLNIERVILSVAKNLANVATCCLRDSSTPFRQAFTSLPQNDDWLLVPAWMGWEFRPRNSLSFCVLCVFHRPGFQFPPQ